MNWQPAVEALEKDRGKDWRREGPVGRRYSARRPLIEKVQVHVSQGCTVQAAISLVEMERGSRSRDRFYKDIVRKRNGRVVVPRRRRKVAVSGVAAIHGRKVLAVQGNFSGRLI